MSRAEQARQPYPVALADRERVQEPPPVGDRAESFQREVDPAVGVPGVEPFGCVERPGIVVGRPGKRPGVVVGRLGERPGRFFEGEQGRAVVGQGRFDQRPDGVPRLVRKFLAGDPESAGELHGSGVRGERPGQDAEQSGLATAVLADDPPAGSGRDGEIDSGQARAIGTNSGGNELRHAVSSSEREGPPTDSSARATDRQQREGYRRAAAQGC